MEDLIIDKLIDRIREMQNPSVVGLDPQVDFIPKFILDTTDLETIAGSYLEFNRRIIDEIYDIVPAVKPQIAMYEELGIPGMQCYIDTVNYAKSKGMFVIGDIKRGDISSTAEAYANAHLGEALDVGKQFERISANEKNEGVEEKDVKIESSPKGSSEKFSADFVTLNPYMGSDSINPFLKKCEEFNKGIFVLVKTSNKSSAEVQDLELSGGKKLYEHIGGLVSGWGENCVGKYGYSSAGAVVGATFPQELAKLREIMPRTFFLIPGYGAQGGRAADLAPAFIEGIGGIVNSSRGIICAYKNGGDEKKFAKEARMAALAMKKDFSKVI